MLTKVKIVPGLNIRKSSLFIGLQFQTSSILSLTFQLMIQKLSKVKVKPLDIILPFPHHLPLNRLTLYVTAAIFFHNPVFNI